MRCSVLLLVVLAVLTGGCAEPMLGGNAQRVEASSRSAGTYVIALDTSGSAADARGRFFRRAREIIMRAPADALVELYRFDSDPAEFYSGPPHQTDEEASMELKRGLDRRSRVDGTNMLKLFQRIDRRLPDYTGRVSIWVFTDCGIEKMTQKDLAEMARLTALWAARGTVEKIRLVGVEPGHREKLRDNIRFPRLTIE